MITTTVMDMSDKVPTLGTATGAAMLGFDDD